jgi:hypothetical protein
MARAIYHAHDITRNDDDALAIANDGGRVNENVRDATHGSLLCAYAPEMRESEGKNENPRTVVRRWTVPGVRPSDAVQKREVERIGRQFRKTSPILADLLQAYHHTLTPKGGKYDGTPSLRTNRKKRFAPAQKKTEKVRPGVARVAATPLSGGSQG